MIEQVLKNSLRERRKAAGMSVEDLSVAADVAISTIKEIERGHAPTPSVQLRLASALGCRVEELFFWEDAPPQAVAS